jgi:hypothetical protein
MYTLHINFVSPLCPLVAQSYNIQDEVVNSLTLQNAMCRIGILCSICVTFSSNITLCHKTRIVYITSLLPLPPAPAGCNSFLVNYNLSDLKHKEWDPFQFNVRNRNTTHTKSHFKILYLKFQEEHYIK